MINEPPNRDNMLVNGVPGPTWAVWFTQVYRSLMGQTGPFPLQSYQVAQLPPPGKFIGALVYVSNALGGPVIAYSDGQWKRIKDGTVVS